MQIRIKVCPWADFDSDFESAEKVGKKLMPKKLSTTK
jgi:hypothetical protein